MDINSKNQDLWFPTLESTKTQKVIVEYKKKYQKYWLNIPYKLKSYLPLQVPKCEWKDFAL